MLDAGFGLNASCIPHTIPGSASADRRNQGKFITWKKSQLTGSECFIDCQPAMVASDAFVVKRIQQFAGSSATCQSYEFAMSFAKVGKHPDLPYVHLR